MKLGEALSVGGQILTCGHCDCRQPLYAARMIYKFGRAIETDDALKLEPCFFYLCREAPGGYQWQFNVTSSQAVVFDGMSHPIGAVPIGR
jgi:hypothetical protein